jgi:wobble nucleotide-excising tRNase
MIKDFRFIGSVGCFDSFTGTTDTEFRRLNLIYAENGRGKTTLVAVLRSLADGNPGPIMGRKRLGAQHDPRVVLRLDDGANRVFQNGAWSAVHDSLLIFDDHFVDDNVYSGLSIGADHRQNLHEVILGSQGVNLKRKVDALAERISQLTREVRERQNAIPVDAMEGLSIDTFCGLPEPGDDDDQRRSEITRQLTALDQVERVRSTRFFSRINFPVIDVDAIQTLLRQRLDDLDATAVSHVQGHLTQLGSGAERWVADGVPRILALGDPEDERCPFCGQGVSGVDLVDKYRAYFGQAYRNLQSAIDDAHRHYSASFGGDELARVQREFVQLADQHAFWKSHVEVPELKVELESLVEAWQAARNMVLQALSEKRAAPLEAKELPAATVKAVGRYSQLVGEFVGANEALVAKNDEITAVKESTEASDAADLKAELQRRDAAHRRQS